MFACVLLDAHFPHAGFLECADALVLVQEPTLWDDFFQGWSTGQSGALSSLPQQSEWEYSAAI